jgi:hypothetical protein
MFIILYVVRFWRNRLLIYYFFRIFCAKECSYIKNMFLYLRGKYFEGTVQRSLLLPIFSQMDSSQASYSVFKGFSKFGFKFEEIFAIFDWLSAIIYGGESILPVLFHTMSCDSPPDYSGESLFVRIIFINSRLSIRRVDTPPYCLISLAGNNCWQRGVFFKTLEDSLFL